MYSIYSSRLRYIPLLIVVVISSWVNVIVEATGIQLGIEVSTLRALRVLRVLRSLKFFSGIKTILNVIAQAMPYSFNVIAFMGFLYIVCGIIGLQMFRSHTLSRCEYGSFDLQAELQHDKFPLVYPNGSLSYTIAGNPHPSPKPLTIPDVKPPNIHLLYNISCMYVRTACISSTISRACTSRCPNLFQTSCEAKSRVPCCVLLDWTIRSS